jgi:predicted O-linked N-acetylglucosamine transferase (SPINDLY family)
MQQNELLRKFMEAFRGGKLGAVPELLQKAQKKFPKAPWLPYAKGTYLFRTGKIKEAIPHLEKNVELSPKNLEALMALATAFMYAEEYEEANKVLKRIFRIDPNHIEALRTQRTVLYAQGDPVGCKEICEKIMQLRPDMAGNITYLAKSLAVIGDSAEAYDYFNKALELKQDRILATNMIFHSNYMILSQEQVFELHKKYAYLFEKPFVGAYRDTPLQTINSKIKIGFVSADFRKHSVAYFLEPLFENYDKEKFEFLLFANTSHEDEISSKFKDLTDAWFNISKMTDEQTAELIKKERVNLLIDLNGHTFGNRLGVFGLKPAPVQATWLGYPNTTGLASIDYRITDSIADSETAQSFHTEKLLRLPGCFLCYKPSFSILNSQLSTKNSDPVFGSFNVPDKISQKCIEMWSEVLKNVTNSRLFLKHKHWLNPKMRELFCERFAKYGIESERIEFKNRIEDEKEHLMEYNNMDIALDTFPYNGTTTTCEAMFMGVPTVSLLGESHAARVSASLNINAGFECLVAKNEREFVQIAMDLAANVEKLLEFKNKMRAQMLASDLCNGEKFARAFTEEMKKICYISH